LPALRLFGPLAEAAGTRQTQVDGATVGECLRRASDRFGEAFSGQLASCRVVVGEVTLEPDEVEGRPVSDHDEIVVLPPVGGGGPARTDGRTIPR